MTPRTSFQEISFDSAPERKLNRDFWVLMAYKGSMHCLPASVFSHVSTSISFGFWYLQVLLYRHPLFWNCMELVEKECPIKSLLKMNIIRSKSKLKKKKQTNQKQDGCKTLMEKNDKSQVSFFQAPFIHPLVFGTPGWYPSVPPTYQSSHH